GNGDGTFQPPVPIITAVNGFFSTNLIVADFNNDGRPDLAIGPYVLLNSGNGTTPFSAVVGNDSYSSLLAAADVNGDGRMDLVSSAPSGVEVLLGNGDGTFQFPL